MIPRRAIVDGNRKVLAARLSDARFFWEQDRRSAGEHAEKLARITFHEKLGTVADKVERVAKLAEWLVRAKGSSEAGVGDRTRPLQTRPSRPIRNRPRACARPISSPRWSANSPNCRA
jgi:glycyl-tRNA synthetase beta chain